MGNLFIAAMIREPAITSELDKAWDQILKIMPQGAEPRRQHQPHITLRFLSEIDANLNVGIQVEEVDRLDEELNKITAEFEQCDLTLGYPNTFPGVVWISVGGTPEAIADLKAIQEKVAKTTDQAKINGHFPKAPDKTNYLPHITIGKFNKEFTNTIQESITKAQYPDQLSFQIEQLEILHTLKDRQGNSKYITIRQPSKLKFHSTL